MENWRENIRGKRKIEIPFTLGLDVAKRVIDLRRRLECLQCRFEYVIILKIEELTEMIRVSQIG